MNLTVTREQAIELLKEYNKEEFHLRHAYTVEAVMRWYAQDLGYADEVDFWGIVGLLHDIDYEMFPDQHCIKAPELLAEIGTSEEMTRAIVSHSFGHGTDTEPVHEMEKVLYAIDELTGLIWAYALMRPEKNCKDMKLKSLKKKFKDKKFAAGCNRDIIKQGAEMLGWDISELLEKTIAAMQDTEESINQELQK